MARARQSPRRRVAGDVGDPAGMARAVADYLDWLEVRNYSPTTVDARAKHLRELTIWMAERGVTGPAEVTRPMVERYQRHLFLWRKSDGTPLSFYTQSQRLGSARDLFRWLARHHRILYNPAAEIELPKVEHRIPRTVLNVAEVEAVLATPDLTTPVGLRDRAMLEVFYSTGVRRAELARLAVWDIDARRGTVLVRLGKGRKDRTVPIGERALVWVDRYLADVRPNFAVSPDDGFLFVTNTGEPVGLEQLTALVHRYLDRADIAKTGSCHVFRHTMATLMLERGADIRYIQEILGHAQLSTTQIYTHVSIAHLKAIHTATHPGATNTRHRNIDADHPSLRWAPDAGGDRRDPLGPTERSEDGSPTERSDGGSVPAPPTVLPDTALPDTARADSAASDLLAALEAEAAEEDEENHDHHHHHPQPHGHDRA